MSAKLPDQERCTRAAAILKSIAHPQRLFILCCLFQNEMTVSELEELAGASQPVISQHLTRMRLEGIVEPRRDGNHVYYQLANTQVQPLIKTMEKIFSL
jgi:ArsR family transcriptional regulator